MKSDLRRVTETWEMLGKEDPLWAIFTRPDKRGGRWDLHEFMVEVTAAAAGLKLLHREPDTSAGGTTEGFFYIFEKS